MSIYFFALDKILNGVLFGANLLGVPKLIYFVQAVNGGAIKIGYSANVLDRLKSLQCASPLKLQIIGLMKGSPLEERTLHNKFVEARLHGEWFDNSNELEGFISKLPKFDISSDYITDEQFPKADEDVCLYLYKAGYNLGGIGSLFGISRQRVHQILNNCEEYKNIKPKERPRKPQIPIEEFYFAHINLIKAR